MIVIQRMRRVPLLAAAVVLVEVAVVGAPVDHPPPQRRHRRRLRLYPWTGTSTGPVWVPSAPFSVPIRASD